MLVGFVGVVILCVVFGEEWVYVVSVVYWLGGEICGECVVGDCVELRKFEIYGLGIKGS